MTRYKIAFVLFLFSMFFGWFYFQPKTYEIDVKSGNYGYAYIEALIDGYTKKVAISLDSSPGLRIGINSKERENFLNASHIKTLTCNKLVFKELPIGKCSGDNLVLSGLLSSHQNLLIDFPNEKLCLCNKQPEITKKWKAIPFEIQDFSPILKISTPLGVKSFMLNAISTFSAIDQSLVEDGPFFQETTGFPAKSCLLFPLVLGDYELSIRKLWVSDLINKRLKVDGMLGMDFLKTHSIYFDMKNHIAWIKPSEPLRIPLERDHQSASIFTFNITLNEKPFVILFDLGLEETAALSSSMLSVLETIPQGQSVGTLVSGYSHTFERVKAKAFNFCGLKLKDVTLLGPVDKWFDEHAINDRTLHVDGLIGANIIQNTNLFLDFKNDVFCMTNEPPWLHHQKIKEAVCVPFKDYPKVTIQVQTEEGLHDLVIDTGCTHNLWREGATSLEKIAIGGKNFGGQNFREIKDKTFPHDGILGLDFLNDKALYIDGENELLWIWADPEK